MIKLTLDKIKEVAKERGIECISNEYVNSKKKLKFLCKNNHIFEANASNFLYHNNGCVHCGRSGQGNLSFDKVLEILNLKEMKFVSGDFVNIKSKLNIECKKGHKFISSIQIIKRESFKCPFCRKEKPEYKLTISKFKEIAKNNGGDCISEKYEGKDIKLEFICKQNHKWFANPNDIISNNSWCPYCAGLIKKSKKDLIDLIDELNLNMQCLNIDKFENSKTILKFLCQNNHEWETSYNRIYNGTTCPFCSNLAKLTIENLQNFLNKEHIGAKLLSTNYVNNKEKLEWQCEKGHIFCMSAKSVKNSLYWCPECYEYKTENLCREILNDIFKEKFIKIRPKWLIGYKNQPLELDGYCAELNLAFEYNGMQHYKFITKFHGTYDKFIEQQQRDILKYKICDELNIKLIIIPYIRKYDKNALILLIKKLIQDLGVTIND